MKNAEKVIDAINAYVSDNGPGKIVSREEFYEIVLAKYPEVNRTSVYPSDFCYNLYNSGLRYIDDGERCLECVDKGYFKILGTNYKYTKINTINILNNNSLSSTRLFMYS